MSDCNQTPVKFVSCCDVMDCIDIKSVGNTVEVTKDGCGVNLEISPNTIDNLLQINNGECITWIKEFISGKLNLTPVIDWTCVASHVCDICNPPTCPQPIELTVAVI